MGGTQQSFTRGGSAPTGRSKLLPFYIPILTENVPLSYTFHRKLYPFHIPTERLNFSLEKPLKILRMNQSLCASVRDTLKVPFLNRQFSQPFSILQLVKSLPFCIPPACKGYPFRAEPPRVVHYRECPPDR